MKTHKTNNRAGVAVAALVASIGLVQSSQAIVLSYEQDPDGAGPLAVGSAYTGPVQFKFVNFDNGTQYATLPPNTFAGFKPGVSPVGDTVQTGVTALDVIQAQGAGNAKSNGMFLSGGGALKQEDTWGILRVTNIQDPNGFDLWTENIAGKGTQLTGMFFGEQDFFVENFSPLENRIDGVGIHFDIYEQPILGGTAFNPTLGPLDFPVGGRTGDKDYLNVTDGTLVLSLQSTPGFIHQDGTAGGAAAEFESIFQIDSLSGRGSSFANVMGGADAANFDTNGITSVAGAANFAAGKILSQFTDIKASFTAVPGVPANGGWLVRSNDPLEGNFVPEPTTVLAGLGCMAPILSSLLGRRRKTA